MRRILEGLNHEPSSLSEEEFQCLREEISALGPIQLYYPEPWIDQVREALKDPNLSNQMYQGPTAKGVLRFMNTMEKCFLELADPNKGFVEVGPVKCHLLVSKRGVELPIEEIVQGPIRRENVVYDAIYTVVKSLQTCGGLIARCPETTCQKLFLADRINQVYCSLTCQNRTTSRNWYLQQKSRKGKKSKATKSPGNKT